MSGKLVIDVWHADYGDASMILLLMALADESNDAGECSVNMAKLAIKARQSERNCRYLLSKLEDLQILERFEARGRGHQNRYQLHLGNLKNLQPLPVIEQENLQPLQQLQVLENLQKGQPLQVIEPIKPANPATSAGFKSPFPPDPSSPKKPQDPPLSPQGGATSQKSSRNGATPPKRPARFVPESFEVTPALRLWAENAMPGLNLDYETQKMRDHEYKTPHTDWPKAWRNWMRTAWERLPADAQRPPQQRKGRVAL